MNVANLQLARATAHSREMALRAALGAGKRRIVSQLLVESALLGLASEAVGLALAFAGLSALVRSAPPNLPRLDEVRVDGTVLLFNVTASLGAVLLFGLWPAWRTARVDLQEALKPGGARGVFGGGRSEWVRGALLPVEVALALMLTLGAGLLFRSFLALATVDLGYQTQGRLVLTASIPAKTEAQHLRAGATFERIFADLRALPGVSAVAVPDTSRRWACLCLRAATSTSAICMRPSPSRSSVRPSRVMSLKASPLDRRINCPAGSTAARKRIAQIDSAIPVKVATLEQFHSDAIAMPRFRTMLLIVFAAIPAALATAGVYGVMSYMAVRRQAEMGVRMALGATGSNVVWLLVRSAAKLTAIGVACGLVAALPAGRFVESMLYGVKLRDPFAIGAAVSLMGGAALLAALIPALRAARVDPALALREE